MQYALKKVDRPPIINTASYTLASPYKEQRHHRTPSESIANNYTPTVQDIKIREIARRFKRLRKGWPPLYTMSQKMFRFLHFE